MKRNERHLSMPFMAIVRKWFRRVAATLLIVAILAAVAVTALYRLAQWEPDFYANAGAADLDHAPQAAKELEKKVLAIRQEVLQQREWRATVSEQQINGWLAHDLPRKFPRLLPPILSQPRVHLTEQLVQFACRYRTRKLSMVVLVKLEPYLTDEPNVLAVRIRDVRLGAVPGLKRKITQHISIGAAQAGLPLRWLQDSSDPTALVDLSGKLNSESSLELTSLEVREGSVTLSGNTKTPSSPPEP